MKTNPKVALNIAAVIAAIFVFIAMSSVSLGNARAQERRTLTVGVGYDYPTIQAAYDAAQPGDVIGIYPLPDGEPYRNVAILVRKPNISFIGAASGDDDMSGIEAGEHRRPVTIDGSGFDYSGVGEIPRAVFQFDKEASGSSVWNLRIKNARNSSHNGAGVRINAANNVKVMNCEISYCDMGIMSNGKGEEAQHQYIMACSIHDNGSLVEAGYSHNLYLGGYSTIVKGCEIFNSVSGHNLKSRARLNLIEACYIHDSANREIDIVDDGELTAEPGADAVIIGSIIAKAKDCLGNRGVIHFGQDSGGARNGVLYVMNCNVATPFITPVVMLSYFGTSLTYANCIFYDFGFGQEGSLAQWTYPEDIALDIKACVASPGFKIADGVVGREKLVEFAPEPGLPDSWLYTMIPDKSLQGKGTPLTAYRQSGMLWKGYGGRSFYQYAHPALDVSRADQELPAIGAFAARY